MARDSWYRLDNIGKFYAAQAGRPAQTIFRFSATMDAGIDEAALQRALDATVVDFPSFAVSLRTGFFWRYLQEADTPRVHRAAEPICAPLHTGRNSVLIRVTWDADRINFETSHMVSDGRGALAFFRELLAHYVAECAGTPMPLPASDGPTRSQRLEDSFDKNYEPGHGGGSMGRLPYRIHSPRLVDDPTYMELHLPVAPVLELAHSWGVSLTSVVISALMSSVRQTMARRDVGKDLRVGVPVDLRGAFDSQTTRNFFGMVYLTVPTEAREVDPRTRALQIQEDLTREVLPDNVKRRMNMMIGLEKNPLLRLAPVFLKDIALRLADQEKRTVTATVSNLGVVRLPEPVAAHVRDVNIITTTSGLNLCLCSFGDDLSIGISTVFMDLSVVEGFVRFFSERGISGYINSSRAKALEGHVPPELPAGREDRDGDQEADVVADEKGAVPDAANAGAANGPGAPDEARGTDASPKAAPTSDGEDPDERLEEGSDDAQM